MKNLEMILGIGWICFMVGAAAGTVGRVFPCTNEPVSWTLPVIMGFSFGGIFFIGWLAGRRQEK
jgi:hypothetical protein